MPEKFYTKKLYPLQDEVLRLIEKADTGFYLSGGTALSRHYLHHRYSDDLDFFQNDSPDFKKDASEIIKILEKEYPGNCVVSLLDERFVRLFVQVDDISLKIEMINDVPFHQGEFVSNHLFNRIDTWENILSNKISALGRNEPKDVADILFIAQRFSFNWMEVIESAKKKDMWVNEIDVSSILNSYQVESLKSLRWIEQPDLEKLAKLLKSIAKNILMAGDNGIDV